MAASPYSRTVRDALALVLFTGCRSGEVVAALWRDIDLERAVWMIRETKNGEPHDVMLSRQAIDLLKARRARRRDPCANICPHSCCKPWLRQPASSLAVRC